MKSICSEHRDINKTLGLCIVAKSGLCRGSISVLTRPSWLCNWNLTLIPEPSSLSRVERTREALWCLTFCGGDEGILSIDGIFRIGWDMLEQHAGMPARFYRFRQSSRKWKMDARVGSLFSTMVGLCWFEISGTVFMLFIVITMFTLEWFIILGLWTKHKWKVTRC